ncbi:PfkB family carbohydrate kinase [Azospirillum sp.]|uniref:PfkB family carbohydrate kinase n=1 Tax=Azospirillum sp. TaxID=34012 RepID=UPI002D368E42|nr:PfkB family carbohydrate kinase [Azospirillum sp.]HYD70484.1 PfkB family carbohydrate kinase [Azospirillum sp.]
MHTEANTVSPKVRPARAKITTVADLAGIAAQARAAGKTVVLAHGVFDLLHLGHVRHLEAARREGHVLLVTLTADRFVNKGPGRPVFSEQLRTEMVASLEYVDHVAVNEQPSAEDLIRRLRPDVYVKGSDYAAASDDVTGKIVAEREVVEAHGGRIVFTEDITFSSSSLINRYLNIYEPTLQGYLETMRANGGLERVLEAIEAVKDMKLLFIGDAIVDEYNYVNPMGKSAKENMIATLFQGRELFAGGVFAAANHVASFCAKVDIVTGLGTTDGHEALIRDSLRPNVSLTSLWRDGAPTTRKARFIDGYSLRKLFEVYHMDDSSLPTEMEEELRRFLDERLEEYDGVVVTDFGHGLISPATIGLLNRKARFLAVNAQTNSANHGFNLITKYRRADYVSIDANEARLAMQDKFNDMADLVGRQMPAALDCPNIIVTQGKHGCIAYDRRHGVCRVPALTSTIVDTVGAGDAFFSITAPMVARDVPMDVVGFVGNAAGAMKVGIVGHRTSVEKVPLIKFVTALLK